MAQHEWSQNVTEHSDALDLDGENLSKSDRAKLEKAKDELRAPFDGNRG